MNTLIISMAVVPLPDEKSRSNTCRMRREYWRTKEEVEKSPA